MADGSCVCSDRKRGPCRSQEMGFHTRFEFCRKSSHGETPWHAARPESRWVIYEEVILIETAVAVEFVELLKRFCSRGAENSQPPDQLMGVAVFSSNGFKLKHKYLFVYSFPRKAITMSTRLNVSMKKMIELFIFFFSIRLFEKAQLYL